MEAADRLDSVSGPFLWFALFALAAFLVAWIANALVALMMGEHPRDTDRLWLDVFLRFFVIAELGWIGRILSYFGFHGWMRKLVLIIGLLGFLAILAKPHPQSDVGRYVLVEQDGRKVAVPVSKAR